MGLIIAVIGATSNVNIFFNCQWSKPFCVVMIFPFLYSLFLVGCRGPLISAILGLFFYCSLIFKKRLKITIATGIILFFVMIIWVLNGDIVYSILDHIPNISGYSLTHIKEGPSTAQRLKLHSSAILLFLQKPLLGVGTGGFPVGYPHNLFLEIAAENGIIGFIIFICFLFLVIQKGFKYMIFYLPKLDEYSKNISLIILTLSVTLFIEKQFSYSLDMHKDLFVFFGLVVNLPLIKTQNKKDEFHKEGNKYGL